jgi:hypothetical protein
MFSSVTIRAFFAVAGVTTVLGAAQGCVADRPSRNGVFNENQYIRKDFLVQPGTGGGDPGWYMKATIVQTSDPNPLANGDMFTGAENSGALVRFNITQDTLELLDMRELTNSGTINNQNTRTPAVVNAWPITNVDLKYQVNLDGEKTNFYQENQELDWQVRQWVKVNFDKNDFSDIEGLGTYQQLVLEQCANTVDATATLVPGSFLVDTTNNYMQWTVSVAVPLELDTGITGSTGADCATLFGSLGSDFVRMGRSNVTLNVMYSMVRAQPVDSTKYTPLVIDEKDPILHKYGPITITNWSRDPNTGLQAARQLGVRYNPNENFTFYFAQGYPQAEQAVWTRKGGIVDQTNAILTKAGAKGQLNVLNYNDQSTLGDGQGPERQYGDVRYSFIRWESDLDTGSPFFAVTQFQPDLRTGQLVSASINVADEPLKDYIGQRLQAYLEQVVGYNPSQPATDLFANPPLDPSDPNHMKTLPTNCTSGATIPLTTADIQANVYSQSTLYQKMAQYLPAPLDGSPAPGPSDYVYQHQGTIGTAFQQAFLALQPYLTYADPTMNQFVTPSDLGPPPGVQAFPQLLHGETGFQNQLYAVDHGVSGIENAGSGQAGMQALYNTVDGFRQSWAAHRDYMYKWSALPHSLMRGDTADIVSFPALASRGSRMCVNGAWESQSDWVNRIMENMYELVIWHEFGHVMGMEHNFMGSIDKANWPTYKDANGNTNYAKYSSSVMEYSQSWDDAGWNSATNGWLAYDQGAIGFMYGNNLSSTSVGPVAVPSGKTANGISGQISATVPWNDPYGWNGSTETQFLYCSHQHLRYTPLCRMDDVGGTPSEITAADIEAYDFNYKWRNFRNYYKVWDDSTYGTKVANIFDDTRRFLSMAYFDWSPSELQDDLIRIGLAPPSGAVNVGLYYAQLTQEFQADIGAAEQLVAAFHEAVIQQSTGQRPYLSVFDPFFGDVTQQGIAIDKELAFTNWLGIWPFDNYDPTQANGLFGSALVIGPGDAGSAGGNGGPIPAQSWSAAGSMLGEKGPWDAYPGFFPAAVSLFAHDTQTATFVENLDRRPHLRPRAGRPRLLPQHRRGVPGLGHLEQRPARRRQRQRGLRDLRDLPVQPDAPADHVAGHRPLQRHHPGLHRPRRAALVVVLPAGPQRVVLRRSGPQPVVVLPGLHVQQRRQHPVRRRQRGRPGLHVRSEDQVHDRRVSGVRRQHPGAVTV